MQVHTDRVRCEPGEFSDFSPGAAFDEPERQRLAVRLRQRVDRCERLAGFSQPIRSIRAHECVMELHLHAAGAEMIRGAVARDRRYPAGKGAGIAKRPQPAPGDEEDVLDEVGGSLRRYASNEESVNVAAEPRVQDLERAGVTLLSVAYEPRTFARSESGRRDQKCPRERTAPAPEC